MVATAKRGSRATVSDKSTPRIAAAMAPTSNMPPDQTPSADQTSSAGVLTTHAPLAPSPFPFRETPDRLFRGSSEFVPTATLLFTPSSTVTAVEVDARLATELRDNLPAPAVPQPPLPSFPLGRQKLPKSPPTPPLQSSRLRLPTEGRPDGPSPLRSGLAHISLVLSRPLLRQDTPSRPRPPPPPPLQLASAFTDSLEKPSEDDLRPGAGPPSPGRPRPRGRWRPVLPG